MNATRPDAVRGRLLRGSDTVTRSERPIVILALCDGLHFSTGGRGLTLKVRSHHAIFEVIRLRVRKSRECPTADKSCKPLDGGLIRC